MKEILGRALDHAVFQCARFKAPVLAFASMQYSGLIALGAMATLGCAPALSTMRPAHVAPKGHFQAELGMDISIPTGTIVDVVEAGDALVSAADNRDLSEEERKEVFEAGVALAFNPPSVTQHIALAYTPLKNWDIALRYSISAIGLLSRYQILHSKKHGVDFSAGFGVSRYVYEFPVSSVLGILELEDYTRWQFEFPLQFGWSGSWYRAWGGPRVMLTTFGTSLKLSIPFVDETELASFSGTGVYLGGQIGAALGYKYVFFGVELTMVELLSSGHLNAFGNQLLDTEINSFLIYPSFGLMGEF